MLTTPLFAIAREGCASKRMFRFLKFHSRAFWYAVMLVTSLVLLISDQNNARFTQSMRISLIDFSAPVIEQASYGLAWMRSGIDNFRGILGVNEENKRLMEENNALKKWQDLAYRLRAENQSLKQQLHIVKEPTSLMLTARVITYPSGLLTKNILVKAGRRDGVKKDQPVVAKNAVLGRIVEVGETTSRVLLIMDLNSRIPVTLESSRVQAILTGTNSDLPKLTHFENDDTTKLEGRVLTSGKGGIFPPGLLLGKIVTHDHGHYVVSPISLNRLEYVHILTNPTSLSQTIADE